MNNRVTLEEIRLIEHVSALEYKSRVARGRELLSRLYAQGINPEIQEWHFPQTTNFIVDFSSDPNEKRLLFCAHYDAVKDCPGANDNASSVAVLLGLCQLLKNTQTPARVVFFDREESWLRTPFVRLGLLGSLYYVFSNNLKNVEAVYNLEFCGLGDSLSVWPVKDKKKDISAVRSAKKAAAKLNLKVKLADVPGLLLSSDHLSFRLKGISNSITLSLLPADQLQMLEQFVSNLSIRKILMGQRPIMPGVLSHVHKATDDSSRLNEDSLRLMLSLLVEIIKGYKF
ncbi:M28 family metallopeptidase [Chloroflexota bacterium]